MPMIACVVIPFFAAVVEQRLTSPASGPIIIHHAERVYSVDNDAVQRGVQPGMTLRKARIVCPDGQFVPARPAEYRHAFARLLDILRNFTPLVEPGYEAIAATNSKRRSKTRRDAPFASDDSVSAVCYLDLETLREAECAVMARHIIRAVRLELGIDVALGVARGKFPARVAAASVLPGSECLIPSGSEGAFLAPLPVTILPLADEMARRLALLGISTLDQLARLPADSVSLQFGKTGYLLRQWAEGKDTRRVIPEEPQLIEQASREFDDALLDRAVLDSAVRAMADELAQRLQLRALMGHRAEILITLADGSLHEKRLTLRQPVSSAGHISEIFSQLVGQLLTPPLIPGGITRIEVSLSELVPAVGQQLDLFVQQMGQDKLLRTALKDIVARYGSECFYWISLSEDKSHLPERGFHLRPADGSNL